MQCDVGERRKPVHYNLSFSTKLGGGGGGAYTWDTTFSLANTPSLSVPRPQLRVQIEEDNAFDDL